jgi:hypothetical protein
MPELYGKVTAHGRFWPHCGVVTLDEPHEGRKFAVLNMETVGRGKLPFDDGHLVIGTPVAISKFKVGSEAVLALEVAAKNDG